MNKKEKQAYLAKIHVRYNESGKVTRSAILDEFCTVCNYNRKYAIRLLQKPQKRQVLKPGPKPTYNTDRLLNPLKTIWFAADQPCSKRLKAIIPSWLKYYESGYGALSEDDRNKLLAISSATTAIPDLS